jgi:hypothetical protein
MSIKLLHFATIGLILCSGCRDRAAPLEQQVDRAPALAERVKPKPPREEALEFLESVIDAHGGEANLRHLARSRIKVHWVATLPEVVQELGKPMRTVVEDIVDLPDRQHRRIFDDSSGREVMRFIVKGGVVWSRDGEGKPFQVPLPPGAARDLPALTAVSGWLDARNFAGDLRIDSTEYANKPAVCFTMATEHQILSRNYFDAKTRHILGVVKDVMLPPDNSMQKVETIYTDYKSFGPVSLPTKARAIRDGVQVFEHTLLEVEPLDTVDDALFEPPEQLERLPLTPGRTP